MHLLLRRDLDHHDLVYHLVRDLVLLQPMVDLDDNFHQLMERPYQCAVDIAMVHLMHLQGVVMVGALQNLVALNLVEVLPFQDVVRRYLADVQVDAEVNRLLNHRWKMDYFQDVVGVELRHRLRRDYFQDVVLVLSLLQKSLM
jgi:hypothetical protein